VLYPPELRGASITWSVFLCTRNRYLALFEATQRIVAYMLDARYFKRARDPVN
jgi:hypothetical protein